MSEETRAAVRKELGEIKVFFEDNCRLMDIACSKCGEDHRIRASVVEKAVAAYKEMQKELEYECRTA